MKKEELVKLIGKNPEKCLIVVRGVSGSGKSTLAEYIAKQCQLDYHDHYICEADDYHYDDYGKYCFDPSKIHEAHSWCKSLVNYNLVEGYSCIVSNTSTKLWEMKPYLDLAEAHNYRVIVLRATGNFKNIHNVPEEVLKAQKSRFEDYEGEIHVS